MSKEERMMSKTTSKRVMAMATSSPAPIVDNTINRYDIVMTTTSKEELSVWAYNMTQYNLKPGLCKFGNRGKMVTMKELTQLHVMYTWVPMYADKLSREQKMKALSSRGEHALMGHCNELISQRRKRHPPLSQPN